MEYTQITLDDWMSMKERLKKDLIGVQESFVRIGYTLRKIEEQELYKQDGYKTVVEFAKEEYGLSKSTVSRFISINKKYSIDGYSDRLRPEFAQLGSSKLSEMLSLPDQDMAMIRQEATREGIRELKQFNREEPESGAPDDIRTIIEKFFEVNQEALNDVYSSEAYETGEVEKLIDLVNPSGNKTFRNGIYFMMMYESEIKIKKFGQSPQSMSWAEFFGITRGIFAEAAAGDQTWQRYFGTEEEAIEEQEEEMEGAKVVSASEEAEEQLPGQLEYPRDYEKGIPVEDNAEVPEALEEAETLTEKEEMMPGETEESAEESVPVAMESEVISEAVKTAEEPELTEKIAPAQRWEFPRENAGFEIPQEQEKLLHETSKTEETEPEEEVESTGTDSTEVTFFSRKVYLDTLTVYEAAAELQKMVKSLENRQCLEDVGFWEHWLGEMVDDRGTAME